MTAAVAQTRGDGAVSRLTQEIEAPIAQMPAFVVAPMPVVDGPHLSSIIQRQASDGRIKEQTNVFQERGLILFDEEQIVPARIEYVSTERTLAEEGIAGQDASGPVDTIEQRWGDRQFRLTSASVLAMRPYGIDIAADSWPQPTSVWNACRGPSMQLSCSADRFDGPARGAAAGGAGASGYLITRTIVYLAWLRHVSGTFMAPCA